jgi:hypothetical protein
VVRRLGDRNVGLIRGIRPFDPFPFPFLTMTVSLEAIFLALFVLASQNRLARQADKRSHLDLQINLLAKREMTAVLQLLQDIARHLDVHTTVSPEQLRDLVKKTDLPHLTSRMEELAEPPHRQAGPMRLAYDVLIYPRSAQDSGGNQGLCAQGNPDCPDRDAPCGMSRT